MRLVIKERDMMIHELGIFLKKEELGIDLQVFQLLVFKKFVSDTSPKY
jgi:hypothetical protein